MEKNYIAVGQSRQYARERMMSYAGCDMTL